MGGWSRQCSNMLICHSGVAYSGKSRESQLAGFILQHRSMSINFVLSYDKPGCNSAGSKYSGVYKWQKLSEGSDAGGLAILEYILRWFICGHEPAPRHCRLRFRNSSNIPSSHSVVMKPKRMVTVVFRGAWSRAKIPLRTISCLETQVVPL